MNNNEPLQNERKNTEFETGMHYQVLSAGRIAYLHVWISDNPPENKENEGCLGFDLFKDDLILQDGGEYDYPTYNSIDFKAFAEMICEEYGYNDPELIEIYCIPETYDASDDEMKYQIDRLLDNCEADYRNHYFIAFACRELGITKEKYKTLIGLNTIKDSITWKKSKVKNELKHFYNIGELKAILADIPDEYEIEPFGEGNCAIMVADECKRVFLDCESWFESCDIHFGADIYLDGNQINEWLDRFNIAFDTPAEAMKYAHQFVSETLESKFKRNHDDFEVKLVIKFN